MNTHVTERPGPTDYDRMPQWGTLHLTMCVVATIACGMFIVAARESSRTVEKMLGWILGVSGVAWAVYCLRPKYFDVRESLPLHLCDVLRPIMAYGLVTGDDRALTLSYYWGIFLNPQAMITPDLSYYVEPKWLRFSTYWTFHILALAIPLAQTFGVGLRPTWKGARFAYGATVAWAAVAMGVNAVTRGNYGFLNYNTAGNSVLDLLPRWPRYIPVPAVGVGAGFAGLTLPWKGGTPWGTRGLLTRHR